MFLSSMASRASRALHSLLRSLGLALGSTSPGPESTNPAVVLETSDHALLMVAKSLLDGAETPYYAQGEYSRELFEPGRIGTGFSVVAGPVRIQVPHKYADEARALLARREGDKGNDA